MDKIKGYTREEILELVRRAEQAKRSNQKLSKVFSEFASERGRAKGSVRNFYYELVKLSEEGDELAKSCFSCPPSVNKIVPFDKGEERELVRRILIGKQQNKSVRRTIVELCDGDEKLCLRYQNKYRNILKGSLQLVRDVAEELGMEENAYAARPHSKVPDFTLKQLKIGIDELVKNIAENAKRESVELKKRCEELTQENMVLRQMLRKLSGNIFSREGSSLTEEERRIN